MSKPYPNTRTDMKTAAALPNDSETLKFACEILSSVAYRPFHDACCHALLREYDRVTILLSGGFND